MYADKDLDGEPLSLELRIAPPDAIAPPDPTLLSSRLWSTKFVEFPAGPEQAVEEEGILARLGDGPKSAALREGDAEAVRPSAMFVTSQAIQKLGTREIIDLLSQLLPSRPIGLEWVDDTSVCVLWRNELLAQAAFSVLTGMKYDPKASLESLPIITTAGIEFEEPFFIRQAKATDVKEKNAASKSKFYREQQRKSRESKPYDRGDRRRTSEGRDGRWKSRAEDLDAELEAYTRAAIPEKSTDDLDKELDEMANDREREF